MYCPLQILEDSGLYDVPPLRPLSTGVLQEIMKATIDEAGFPSESKRTVTSHSLRYGGWRLDVSSRWFSLNISSYTMAVGQNNLMLRELIRGHPRKLLS
jgi:hypothetical protein